LNRCPSRLRGGWFFLSHHGRRPPVLPVVGNAGSGNGISSAGGGPPSPEPPVPIRTRAAQFPLRGPGGGVRDAKEVYSPILQLKKQIIMYQNLQYLPNVALLTGLLVVVTLDFIFGVTRATFNGTRRTSKGFRKTISKFLQYGGCIIVSMVVLNIATASGPVLGRQFYKWFGDLILYLMVYIEVVSIFENMEALAPGSLFVKVFVRPLRRMITFQLKQLYKEDQIPPKEPVA